jgi:Pyruvate/2-oxoacid:ferredoxin oxidoreductase gamma subunit
VKKILVLVTILFLIGTAVGLGGLPLEEENLKKAIEVTAPREFEKNLKAFELGLNIAKPWADPRTGGATVP